MNIRFVDIEYLFEAIKQIEHKPFGCTFKDLTLKKEIKNGFLSEFVFQCNICNKMEYISNENRNSMSMSINSAIVSATLCTGLGYSQLDMISAILNMHNMSNPVYQKIHNEILKHTTEVALDAMKEAGKEEAKLALEDNSVTDDGIPLITVVADGTWSKRSYKTNYNALSCAVSIHFQIIFTCFM